MKQFLVFFLLPCAILLCAMDTPAAYSAFHGYSPATEEGGYTTSTAQREAISLRWTPTVDVGISGWIHSLLRRNRCHSELNEYWRAYLGLDNQVPGMNPAAKTEWDDIVERDKEARGEPLSDFYGTTEHMNQMFQTLADTLNVGQIVRNYELFKQAYPHLAPKHIIQAMYRQGKWVLEHPDTWIQVGKKTGSFRFRLIDRADQATGEQLSLGMLAEFGMKWSPSEGVLRIHDTYDFPGFVTTLSSIPVRPREMKIRGKVAFDPRQGCKAIADLTRMFGETALAL